MTPEDVLGFLQECKADHGIEPRELCVDLETWKQIASSELVRGSGVLEDLRPSSDTTFAGVPVRIEGRGHGVMKIKMGPEVAVRIRLAKIRALTEEIEKLLEKTSL